MTYDSRVDNLKHALRVGELMVQMNNEIAQRSILHDRSKTEPPELEIFNEYTPKLKDSTYGSDEYWGFLKGMKPALDHHYAHNRHHPEHFENGVNDMTLVDLVEMLADWKAATERHADGDLVRSFEIQRKRFGISDQLILILHNTATHFGWIPPRECGAQSIEKGGITLTCTVPVDFQGFHQGPHADGNYDGGQILWDYDDREDADKGLEAG